MWIVEKLVKLWLIEYFLVKFYKYIYVLSDDFDPKICILKPSQVGLLMWSIELAMNILYGGFGKFQHYINIVLSVLKVFLSKIKYVLCLKAIVYVWMNKKRFWNIEMSFK